MHDLVHQILTHLRGMWRRRWIGLGAAWIVAMIGVGIATRVPDRYEASARLYVDTQSLLRPLMQGISIQPNLEQQVSLLGRTLISRPNIEKLVRMADVDLSDEAQSKREDTVDSVMKRLQLGGTPSNNIYIITYRDSNKEQARKIVQSLVTIFVESSLGDKREDTVNAVKFIDDQIKHYEAGLRAAEDRLKSFRLKYLGVSLQSNQTYFARLSTLNDTIENTRLQLRAAEESRDSYRRELAGEAPVLLPEVGMPASAAASTVSVPTIDARLGVLRADLDLLRRRFTDDHPDIVNIRRIIDQLEDQRAKEVAEMAKAAPASSGQSAEPSAQRNPVFQQLKVALAAAEANVASLRATLGSYEAQQARLVRTARLVPEQEAEYAQLNRDYDIQKKTYESLLSRRESATLGEGVADAGGTRFKVIDPPRVSPQPVFPSRLVLLGVVSVAALLAGMMASLAASQLMPTFHDRRSLGERTKRPVLGTITMFPSRSAERLRRLHHVLFAGASTALVASFAALFGIVLLGSAW
jgi:polysaccharide chain length determinant protein (PEP-CTERM system associated)